MDYSLHLEKIKQTLVDMMTNGGFPDVVLRNEIRREILSSYFETVVIKDVVSRYGLRREDKVRSLSNFYLSATASKVTFNSTSKFLKIPVKSVERYSRYLENSYLLFFLKEFSTSPKALETSPRKVYAVDNGFLQPFNVSIGRRLETLVAQHLYRHALKEH
ncbi:hypothetical protein IC006_0102 [Sulfuracidifex tepidarius]|uniref:DUF4143 domain-containing protein n=1 Tax=Sulfuracidifex tepidarius TaxID=1294262 RepID=A0A510DRL5_9CREN|nr:ATP-binding protein [Sulfuracidifex tepidarius]BBG22818.1 hypothetical protein IC006_0102 [Sulfuracidifex tepidarius]